MQVSALGNALFTKTQQKVLGLLYGAPARTFYTNEIVRLAGVGIGSVKRELQKMTEAELISCSQQGNQKHYQANQNCPIYPELHGLVIKTFGIADVIKGALNKLGDQIDLAFIYGSIAKSTDTASSDIDLLIVAEKLSYAELMQQLAPAEQTLARTINPTVYDKNQLQTKLKEKNAFISRILEQPKIIIKGSTEIGRAHV